MSAPRKFTAADGPHLQKTGTAMLKRPNPVYLTRISEPFTVETNEGTLNGNANDYIAYDPISGHVWPVADTYVAQHYVRKEPT